jgi:N utilization substance protein B
MAFQLLFSKEMNNLSAETIFDEGYYCKEIGLPCEFSRMLFVGACEHLDTIDALIEQTSIDWVLSRMPLADKAILRLAVYEMLYVDEVPIGVSIDEAVELAKQFGAQESSGDFVNGVLGQIAKKLEGASAEELIASVAAVVEPTAATAAAAAAVTTAAAVAATTVAAVAAMPLALSGKVGGLDDE